MNPRVKSVKAEDNYVLLLEFSNGEKKRFEQETAAFAEAICRM